MTTATPQMKEQVAKLIPYDQIQADNKWNCRSGNWTQSLDAETGAGWEAFANDIAENGIKDPIELRPNPDPNTAKKLPYLIVTGHRRYRAAGQAKFSVVPAFVNEMTEAEARVRNIQENTERENLKGADLAWACGQLSNLKMSDAEIARKIGRAQSYVSMLTKIMSEVMPKLTQAWRDATVTIYVKDMYAIAQLPKDKQEAKFAELVKKNTEAAAEPDAKGINSWVKPFCVKVEGLGEMLGKLTRLKHIKLAKSPENTEWDLMLESAVKIKANASATQRKKITAAFADGFRAGVSGENEEEEESVAEAN